MDASRLSPGEKTAAISAVILLFVMFVLDWFGAPGDLGDFAEAAGVDTGINAWQAFDFIDIVLFITIVAALALAFMAVNASDPNLPVAGSAIVAGLGILSVLLILYRIIDPVADADRELGLFIGLIAAGGIAWGGWQAMQEEGTSFGEQVDRGGGGGGGAPPPPAG